MSGGRATLVECDTVLGVEDIHDLLEIMQIDAHNAKCMRDAQAKD